MSNEDDLAKAYMILGIEPGIEWQAILARYKVCAKVWHPDRAPDDAKWREEATEELKKLNWARDVLKSHFESESHSSSGNCACRKKEKTESERTQSGPGPDRKSRTSSEPPDFSAFTKGQGHFQSEHSEQDSPSKSRMDEAINEKRLLSDHSLRWKVATALGIAYISLCLFGMAANGAKDTWGEWARGWQQKEVPKVSEPAPIQAQPPVYVPAYNQFPSGNTSSWQNQQDENRKRKEEAAQKKREQDLYFAKLEVDKYETQIQYCNNEITQIDIKLTNPKMAQTTRNQLLGLREYRTKSLGEAQAFLKVAQEKVATLDPTYVPPQPATSYHPYSGSSTANPGSSAPFISTPPSASLRDRLKERKLFP